VSIIQEALKKVGEESKKPEGRRLESVPPTPVKQEHTVKSRTAPLVNSAQNHGVRMVYFITIAVLAAILIGLIVIALQTPTSQINNKNTAQPVLLPKIEPSPQSSEELPVKNRNDIGELGGFILDGIMYIAERPRAIINNIIVGEGESVAGASVEKINKDNVVLKYNESEVTLKLNK